MTLVAVGMLLGFVGFADCPVGARLGPSDGILLLPVGLVDVTLAVVGAIVTTGTAVVGDAETSGGDVDGADETSGCVAVGTGVAGTGTAVGDGVTGTTLGAGVGSRVEGANDEFVKFCPRTMMQQFDRSNIKKVKPNIAGRCTTKESG